MMTGGDDWGSDSDPWPDAEEAVELPARSSGKSAASRYRPIVLRPSKVREIVRKSSGKRVASDFVSLLDQMVIIAIEKLAAVHDGGTKTLSARLLATCPVRMTSIAPIGDATLQKRRKKSVRRRERSKDEASIVRSAKPSSKARVAARESASSHPRKVRTEKETTKQVTLFPL